MKVIVSSATLLPIIAAFAGGFAAQHVNSPHSLLAQVLIPPLSRPNKRPATTEVDAQRFVLVDASGTVHAEIKMNDEKPEIVLYDKDGHIGWRATTNSGLQPVLARP